MIRQDRRQERIVWNEVEDIVRIMVLVIVRFRDEIMLSQQLLIKIEASVWFLFHKWTMAD